MAATAAATRTARTRSAPARQRTAPPRTRHAPARGTPRRRQITPTAGFVPVAVGAVGGLADSGVVVRLTRGRLWIGMLAALLVGIVALNVMALSFSSSSSEAGRQADVIKRQNSAYRAKIATLTASQQVQQTAGRLGLYVPKPNQIGYLRPSAEDAAEAAKRLRAGELSASSYVAPVDPAATAPVTEVAPATETATTTDVAAETTTADAAAVATAPAESAAATATAVSGGGVSSP